MIAHWLPEDFIKATVLFELKDNIGNLSPHGTGLLVNYKETFILLTCKHIVINSQTNSEYIGLNVTLNRNNGSKVTYDISQIHKEFKLKWHFHKNNKIDLAISPIAIDQSLDDIKLVPLTLFEDYVEMPLGEDIFFLGYPLGLGTDNNLKVTPLVRGGLISLKNENKTFLIDANVYPGSSGSPVFYRPVAADLKTGSLGSKREVKFLGIISANINYEEYGQIVRTGEFRVLYQENAGLGIVFSADLAKEVLNYSTFKAMLTRATNAQEKLQKK